MKTFRKRIFGFTVIELMIVLAIIAILAALAYPSYIDYVRKSKRGEAQQLLLNWAVNQEIFRSNNVTYAPVGTDPGEIPAPDHDLYAFRISVGPTATAYTLEANASGDQENDTARSGTSCDILTLDQNGQKQPPECWD